MRITVRYHGPPRGVFQLVRELEDGGLAVDFTPPGETRGVEEELVRVLIHVADQGVDGLIGGGAFAAAQTIVKTFRERLPARAEVEVEGDESAESPNEDAS